MKPENEIKKKAILPFAISIVISLIITGIAFAFIPQLAIFKNFSFPIGSTWYSTLANIGGFYGGIFGPIITAIGLYFIYNTYHAQLDAYNTQLDAYNSQLKETEIAQINKIYDGIQEDIRSIRYRKRQKTLNTEDVGTLMEGIDAIHNYDGINGFGQDSLLNHINLIVLSFQQLLDRIETAELDDKAKERLKNKTCLLAYTTIVWPVFEGIYRPHGKELLLAYFGHVDTMFYYYEKLTRRSMAWLMATERQLIRQENPPGDETGSQQQSAAGSPIQPFLAASIKDIRNEGRARQYDDIDKWLADLDRYLKANEAAQPPLQDLSGAGELVLAVPTAAPFEWRDLAKHVGRAAIDKLPIPYELKQRMLDRGRIFWPPLLVASPTDDALAGTAG